MKGTYEADKKKGASRWTGKGNFSSGVEQKQRDIKKMSEESFWDACFRKGLFFIFSV